MHFKIKYHYDNCISFDLGTRRGVPIHTMHNNNQASRIDSRLIPNVESVVQEFERNGGQLTVFSSFGEDPHREIALWLLRGKPNFTDNIQTFKNSFTM